MKKPKSTAKPTRNTYDIRPKQVESVNLEKETVDNEKHVTVDSCSTKNETTTTISHKSDVGRRLMLKKQRIIGHLVVFLCMCYLVYTNGIKIRSELEESGST